MLATLFSLSLVLGSADALAHVLAGIDNVITPAHIAALSSDPPGELIAVAEDDGASEAVRGRAIALLAHFLDSRAWDALVVFAAHDKPALRIKAVKALGFLARREPALGEAVTPVLSDRLADADRFVRMQAVRGLARVPGARAKLVAQLDLERDEAVRDLLGHVLSR
jgi:hypothetical protein